MAETVRGDEQFIDRIYSLEELRWCDLSSQGDINHAVGKRIDIESVLTRPSSSSGYVGENCTISPTE